MRENTEFSSGGERCDAWLYRPQSDGDGAPIPVIVMAHGLGGTKAMHLDAYAQRFTAAGYACLVFDYRHFGDSAGLPRQLLSVPRQLADWEAAIAFARSLPGIDAGRVVTWGTSFGGGHSLTMAARDHRLAAAIAQCPFTDGLASALAVNPLTSARVTFAAVRDLIGAARGAAPRYLPSAARPGTPSFMSAHDALPGITALGAEDADFDNRITARSAFDVLLYAPGRHTRDIRCPVYVALCDPDTVAPNRTAERQTSRASTAEVHTYPVGHFDIYFGEHFDRAVSDYLDFLRRHVPVAT